jgi:hypothetical protein
MLSMLRPLALITAVTTLATASVATVATAARRWNATGHEVIASIAWNHLTPQARARAVQLLRNGPPEAHLGDAEPTSGSSAEREKALFVHTSLWADQIKGRSAPNHAYDRPVWHYTDYYWREQNGKIVLVPELKPDPENALERLALLPGVLSSGAPDSARAVALAWIEHLVGDVHQPLHLSARVTAESPKGDRGGNDLKLAGTQSNLHSYWDGILDILEKPPAGDRSGYVDGWAAKIEKELPISTFTKAELDAEPEAWGKESLTLAEELLYPATLVAGTAPSDAYKSTAGQAGKRRIALAGYRLATVLNRLLAK